jgi:nucleotide-binding universal stress UspA family protein
MLNIRNILLPLDLQESALPVPFVRQASALSHRFHAQLLILNVVKRLSYLGTHATVEQMMEEDLASERAKLQKLLGAELDGARHLLVKGDPAREILLAARDERIDLIVMPTHGYAAVERFLMGSVTAKVLHNSECPVWTGAHIAEPRNGELSIRKVLCAVDFGGHSTETTIGWAQNIASEFGAKLTLAHATPSVEIYGPGGYHVLNEMKADLVKSTTEQIAKLQQEMGTQAEVFIGSGDVSKVMSQAAKETGADLIVVGPRAVDGRFGTNAYGIIREAGVPVLRV